ncbi:MAG TPA: TonB-dependent receptor [Steroidobacteraceae bacterium]|nr:TonB-dependent receptor [Steroidobacteraceae bacterium]
MSARCLAAFVVALSLPIPISLASAAAASDAPKDEVLVTATRTPVPESDILVPVTVITRDDLARSLASDAADVLRFQAGLDIGRNGGPGQPASLFLRGTESNHTIILIDGVRVNPGTIGGAALENLNAESIERIELVRGPRSALYGSDAIGGVVNIFTRGANIQGVETYAGYGRYDTQTASLSAGMQGERGGLAFNGSWLDSAGFPTLETSDDDRGYRNLSLGLQGHLQAGAVELRASAWHADGNAQYTDAFAGTPADSDYDDDSAALEGAFNVSDAWRMRLRTTLMQNDIDQHQSPDFAHTRRYSLEWLNELAVGSHNSFAFGAIASREHTDSLSFGLPFDVGTDVLMAYVEDRLEFGRNHLLLAAGYTDHDTAGSKGTWNVDYGFDVSPGLRLVATAGTAFRAPDATDRFGFGGNPDLKPESSRNLEVGVQWRISPAQRLTVNAFRNDIEDLIEFVVLDPVTFDGINENVERARIDGIEAAYRLTGTGWHLQVAASLQDPRNVTENSQLLRRTRASLSLSFVKSFSRGQFGIDVLTAGERKDFGFPADVTLSPYTLVNLTGRFAITPQFDVDARLENALDEDYELAAGYNTPRRGLYVGARYRFGGR